MWQAGDKAYCIHNFKGITPGGVTNMCPNGCPIKGVTYIVDGISPFGGLFILGKPSYSGLDNSIAVGWKAHKFRKIVPRSERATEYNEAINILTGGRYGNIQPRIGFKP